MQKYVCVHGDIRHLENRVFECSIKRKVHGDIRHLEIEDDDWGRLVHVHGDIRHLEIILMLVLVV